MPVYKINNKNGSVSYRLTVYKFYDSEEEANSDLEKVEELLGVYRATKTSVARRKNSGAKKKVKVKPAVLMEPTPDPVTKDYVDTNSQVEEPAATMVSETPWGRKGAKFTLTD